jgi:aspartate/methionine/tyrosine aminotransferase
VAPKGIIQTLTAAGSFLDGGCSRPIQRAAIEVLSPGRADQETGAVRGVFAQKQKITLDRLGKLGIAFPDRARGTFYAWGNVSGLPSSINEGVRFMREAFGHRVLTVPGEFFDVNPHHARTGTSPLAGFVRFSFGPPRENLEAGLSRLEEMVRKAKG